jgi:hypothetical protein
MEIEGSSETLVFIYQTTRPYIPEYRTTNIHRHKNLGSHTVYEPVNESPVFE